MEKVRGKIERLRGNQKRSVRGNERVKGQKERERKGSGGKRKE